MGGWVAGWVVGWAAADPTGWLGGGWLGSSWVVDWASCRSILDFLGCRSYQMPIASMGADPQRDPQQIRIAVGSSVVAGVGWWIGLGGWVAGWLVGWAGGALCSQVQSLRSPRRLRVLPYERIVLSLRFSSMEAWRPKWPMDAQRVPKH